MSPSQAKTVTIAHNGVNPGQRPLSKAQKTFNTLIQQIEQGRAKLAAWEAMQGSYQKKFAAELQPLYQASEEMQGKLIDALDVAYALPGLSKAERREIADVILDMAEDLLTARDDPALKAIFNKYSDVNYDDVEAEDKAMMKSALEDMLGVELGDDPDLSSPDAIMQQAQAKLHERQAQEEAWEQRQSQRKKSAKQLAKEARAETEEKELRLSIREIYRKLASALHPDREPDPKERERKTALMQRVNQAYDKNNLLQLLELQLELEQIDQAAMNNVSEERLKHYNKILREQLAEVQHEIMRVESGFMSPDMLDPFAPVTPKSVMKNLSAQIADLQRDLRDWQKDLLTFQDVHKLKVWLKTLRRQNKRNADFDFPF